VLPDGRRVHAVRRGNRLVIRKYLLALCLIALPLGTVVATGTAANASVRPHSSVTFTGSISCALSGSIKAKPPLTNTASTSTIAISLNGKLSKCTGNTTQGGLTIASGAVKSTATLPKGTTCTGLLTDTPNPAGTIKWKATTKGSITATAFSLSDGSVTSTSPITLTYTSTQTGSFAGTGGTTAVIKQSIGTLLTECGGKGVSSLTLTTGSKVS